MDSFFHQQLQFTRYFKKKLNERLAEVGLYHSQWSIVYYLYHNKTTTLVEISNYFEVEKPTITRTVNRLEERQWIEKVPSDDKRERRIQLTEKGRDIYARAKVLVDSFEKELMDAVPNNHLQTTSQTMQLLLQKIR